MRSRLGARFDVLELVLICVAVAGATWVAQETRHQDGTPEAAALRRAFGPTRYSQYEEEWVVRDYFGGRRAGFFVDVGANHYQHFSNTYYLEVVLGWSGLCVEPLQTFEADYRRYRPRSRCLPFFVSDVSNDRATMYFLAAQPLVTSSSRDFTGLWGSGATEMTVPTITLNDLLSGEHVDGIDFLSLDIELSEPKALAGFDIERYHPELVCIEAHPQVRQQLLDYFARHHYVLVGKYLRADTHNLYFVPAK